MATAFADMAETETENTVTVNASEKPAAESRPSQPAAPAYSSKMPAAFAKFGKGLIAPFLGIVAAMLGFVPAVVAVILGHIGMNTSNKLQGVGRSQAITALVLGYLTIVIIMGTTLFWLIAIGASSTSS